MRDDTGPVGRDAADTDTPGRVEAYWDRRRGEIEALTLTARELAPALVGRSRADAESLARAARLGIRFHAPSEPVPTMFGVGRLTARVERDVVTDVSIG